VIEKFIWHKLIFNHMENNKKLSVEPYKGVRDFYPADLAVQNYIFQQVRQTVGRYGYLEYNASILEESALYRAKTGEEIVNEQTYNFIDRGGREVTLRPEMTPSVARMIARRRQELVFPLRWFNIGSRYRYEKPQRGRQREFWQIDVDCFGQGSLATDAEVIKVAWDILLSLGAKEKDFTVKINHRQLMNAIFSERMGLDDEKTHRLAKLIDRKAKIETGEFADRLSGLTGDKNDWMSKFLSIKDLSELSELSNVFGYQELLSLFRYLSDLGVHNFQFDPTLMRGFDYYTGMVFEIFDNDPVNHRSLFGGGRYDNLVGIFEVEPVSGVGFGSGDVTLRDFLETYQLLPTDLLSGPDYYLGLLSESVWKVGWKLADRKREAGKRVEVDYTGDKVAKIIKRAEKKGAKYLILLGEDEVEQGEYRVKNLAERTEQTEQL